MLRKVNLNFDWEYYSDFNHMTESSFSVVNIPHTNVELPLNNFSEQDYQFESYYKKTIRIGDLINQRVKIHFEGVMSYAKVYIDGTLIGEHKGGYTPFELDLTTYVQSNRAYELGVYVDSREREDIPPFGHVIDYLTFGGIYREVALIYTSQCYVKDPFFKSVDVLTAPKFEVSGSLINHMTVAQQVDVELRILDKETLIYSMFDKVLIEPCNNEQSNQFSMISELLEVELWSVDSPKLYTVELIIEADGKLLDRYVERFGFRLFEFRRDGFYQNGERLKIVGLNRHQSFPYVGYAMPKNVQRKDADILKFELNVNTVRLSHYPQSKHFLDRCDEIGLLVFNELPGWQHIGNEVWKQVAVKNVEEMVLRDRNRPSVFIWGTRINESNDDHDFYIQTHMKAKELDDTRLTGGVRCIKNSELIEDVYTYNDFSHVGTNSGLEVPEKVFKGNKPYLVTEFNGHMYPTKKYDDEKHRISHAIRHMNVLESAYKYDSISGAIGWCMFDYNTHKDFGSGDRICYHGVMDMFRIPKLAAYAYKVQGAKEPVLHVASSMNIGEYEGGFLTEVYAFTNCNYIKLYNKGQLIREFYPDVRNYPNVPCPPILIDDFIGDRLHEEEQFSHRDSDLVKKLLIKVNKNGGVLSWVSKIQLGWLLLKYRLSPLDVENLYTKYFGGWGKEATTYTVQGYMKGQLVESIEKGQFKSCELICKVDEDHLQEDESYDATRIVVRLIDEFGHDLPYANDAFTVETSEHIEVIGPKVLSLIGGSMGFWVKSRGISGEGWVSIKSPRFGVINQSIKTTVLRRNL